MLDKSKLVKKSTVTKALDFKSFVEVLKQIGFVLVTNVINHPKVDESIDSNKGKKLPDIGTNRGWQFIEVDVDESDKPVDDDTRTRYTIGNSLFSRAIIQAKLQDEIYHPNAEVEKLFTTHEKEVLKPIYKTELKRYRKAEKEKMKQTDAILEKSEKSSKPKESTTAK